MSRKEQVSIQETAKALVTLRAGLMALNRYCYENDQMILRELAALLKVAFPHDTEHTVDAIVYLLREANFAYVQTTSDRVRE